MRLKEQNLTQAGTVLILSAIVVKLIGALFKIPLSSDYALGDLGFGYFSAVYDFYIPIYTLAFSGFPVAIAKIVADFTAKKDFKNLQKVFALSLKVLLCMGIMGMLAFCTVAVFIGEDNSFFSFLAISPAVLFCCLSSVYRGYFEGKKNMVPTAASNVIEALGKLCLGLTGAVITVKATGNPALASAAALLGISVGTLVSCIYLKLTFDKNCDFKNSCSLAQRTDGRNLLKSFITFLIPVAIASLSVGITAFIDSLTLRPQLEAIIAENPNNARLLLKDTVYKNIADLEIPTLIYGIKGKAYTLFNLVPTLTTALGIGAVPLVAQCFAKGDIKGLKKNINLCLKLSSVLSLPIAFGFISVGQGITVLLYGTKSAVLGGRLLSLYGIAAFFGGLAVPTTSLLQAASRQRLALMNIAYGVAVKVVCNLVLTSIPSVNVYGTAVGTSACFVVIFLLNIISIIKVFGFSPDFKNCFFKPLISAAACGLAAFCVQSSIASKLGTVLSIAFGGVIYIAFLYILKIITKKELFELVKK